MDSPLEKESNPKHAQILNDSAQSSYSPQDEAIQVPTRAIHPDTRGNHLQMDSIQGEMAGGSRITILPSSPKESGASRRPSHFSQKQHPRRLSFLERIEAAGRDVYRRSVSSTESLIDQLADTLNTLSPGFDPPQPTHTENHKRRSSWSTRLFSLAHSNEASKDMHIPDPVVSRHEAAHPNDNFHTSSSTQSNVELEPSDISYDQTQASYWSVRLAPEELLNQGTDVSDNEDSCSQSPWFNADPESGRVSVPPLSVPVAQSNTKTGNVIASSLHLHHNKRVNNKRTNKTPLKGNTEPHQDLRVANTRKTKKLAKLKEPMIYVKQAQFDNDFENWDHLPLSYFDKDSNTIRNLIDDAVMRCHETLGQ